MYIQVIQHTLVTYRCRNHGGSGGGASAPFISETYYRVPRYQTILLHFCHGWVIRGSMGVGWVCIVHVCVVCPECVVVRMCTLVCVVQLIEVLGCVNVIKFLTDSLYQEQTIPYYSTLGH